MNSLTPHEQSFIRAVGARIRMFRRQRDLDLETLATQTFLSPERLRELEEGESEPYLEDLFWIARALGTGPSELVRVEVEE